MKRASVEYPCRWRSRPSQDASVAIQREAVMLASPHPLVAKNQCACGGGCARCRSSPSDLTLGAPNDGLEREADQAADAILRDAPAAQTRVSRKAAASPANPAVPVEPTLATRIDSMSGRGTPLPNPVRRFFEHRLGTDLGATRLHTDAGAAETARALGADAFTVGRDIAFASGRYQPTTAPGGRLLAHELAHVAQQEKGMRCIQRAQVGRVHTSSDDGTPYFLYELDTTRSTFSQLGNHYGVTNKQVAAANPGAKPTALRLGQQIRVPAFHPPTEPLPVGPSVPGMVQSPATHTIPMRWNTGSNDNQIGRAARGTAADMINGGVYIALASLNNVAQGLVDELRLRALTSDKKAYGYVPAANLHTRSNSDRRPQPDRPHDLGRAT